MTRGPDSEQAIAWATELAVLRGDVYLFRKNRDRPCDFLLVNDREILFVAVRRTRNLYRSMETHAAGYEETIGRLRMVRNPAAGRQLWLFSRRGKYRMFRVSPEGMEEITAAKEDSPGRPAAGVP